MTETKTKIAATTKSFKAPTHIPVQIALLSGHVAYVSPEGTELEQRYWTEAVRAGCIPEGFEFFGAPDEQPTEDAMGALKEVMRHMIIAKDEGDFTASGMPNMKRLCAKAGYNVSREDMAQAWFEVTEEDSAADQ